MQLGVLRGSESGVSPVIGVILMVAVTVVLAAVVGAFVLGVGADQQRTPQATFEVEKTFEGGGSQPDELRITHTGGDSIDADHLYLAIEDAQIQESGAAGTPGPADRIAWATFTGDDTVTAGDAVDLFEPDDGTKQIEGRTVRVIWDDGDGTAILFEWTAPDP